MYIFNTYYSPQFTGARVSFGIQDMLTTRPSLAYTGVDTSVNSGTM